MGILGERVERRFGAGQRLAAGDQACGLVGMGLDEGERGAEFPIHPFDLGLIKYFKLLEIRHLSAPSTCVGHR